MLEATIKAKGQHAVWFSWGRGHTSLSAMDQDETCIVNAIGNGYADLAADEGHRLFDNIGTRDFAAALAAKQRAYCKLIAAVQRRIARVQVAVSIARECDAKRKLADSCTFIEPPPQPEQGDFYDGHGLHFYDCPIGLLAASDQRRHLALRTFWSGLRFAPCVGQHVGTSWLELFALWQTSNGCDEMKALNERRPTFNWAFRCFRKGSMAWGCQHFGHVQD
jgi:hypothetical protein